MKSVLFATTALLLAVPAAAVPDVQFNYEAAGATNTTAVFQYGGKETFDALAPGNYPTFETFFNTQGQPIEIKGVYTGIDILDPDIFSNNTNYAVTFSTAGYSLKLTTSDGSPLTYFGYYLPALDGGNQLQFLKNGSLVASITPADVIATTGACPASPYCGNPGGPEPGANSGEPYAFINIYFNNGKSFDEVRFFEDPTVGGYESDNHTVGYFLQKGGVVPEPATWAMLIAGFGLVGIAARRRREGNARTLA